MRRLPVSHGDLKQGVENLLKHYVPSTAKCAQFCRPMLDQTALDLLFTQARSHNDFDSTPVGKLHALYDVMKMGPTSANCCPARLVFVTSDEAKARLMPFIIESNIEKVTNAPVCAIIANDVKFYDRIPELFPHNPQARAIGSPARKNLPPKPRCATALCKPLI